MSKFFDVSKRSFSDNCAWAMLQEIRSRLMIDSDLCIVFFELQVTSYELRVGEDFLGVFADRFPGFGGKFCSDNLNDVAGEQAA